MQRTTIAIEDDLLAEIDAAAKERGYTNRPKAIRDLARRPARKGGQSRAVAAMTTARDLSK